MVRIMLILLFFVPVLLAQDVIIKRPLRYLALGDSYTIGQSVSSLERWPRQLVDSLEKYGVEIDSFRVIARTGWRTDNLLAEMNNSNLTNDFNLVSLLIGVNDQYQGLSAQSYSLEFDKAIRAALDLVQWQKSSVFVLSIPDYGYTPFGESRQASISADIDNFNAVNKSITQAYGIAYYDITSISRLGLQIPEYVASDGLHPSGAMYTEWVKILLEDFRGQLDYSTSVNETENFLVVHYNALLNKIVVSPVEKQSLFRLYSIGGQLVLSQALASGSSTEIGLGDIPVGLYFYQIQSDSRFLQAGKILVDPSLK